MYIYIIIYIWMCVDIVIPCSHVHPVQALHFHTTAQLREVVVQLGHVEEALRAALGREEACRAREEALKAALERKNVPKEEAIRTKEEAIRTKEELRAKEEAMKVREEAMKVREEAMKVREEAMKVREEDMRRGEEGLKGQPKEAGEIGREGALEEKSWKELQEEVLSLTAKVQLCPVMYL